MSAPIIVKEYDPRWALAFEQEKAAVLAAAGQWLEAVEHVGSTAVPGLAAKPVIDLLVGIRSLSEAPRTIAALTPLGYEYISDLEFYYPERRYLQRLSGGGEHTHHIHMVQTDTAFWADHILFRDYLRAHPAEVREYAALKRQLAARFRQSREEYTDAKGPFIQAVLERARAWQKRT